MQIHDPALRTKYRQSSRFEKLGYEEDFLNKIRRLDDEVRRKIEKNERRLAVTQPLASGIFYDGIYSVLIDLIVVFFFTALSAF